MSEKWARTLLAAYRLAGAAVASSDSSPVVTVPTTENPSVSATTAAIARR